MRAVLIINPVSGDDQPNEGKVSLIQKGLTSAPFVTEVCYRELLSHFHSISRGRYRCSPKIETFSAAEIELASPNVIAVHIEGRPLGQTPVKLRALPGALRVFSPEHPLAET